MAVDAAGQGRCAGIEWITMRGAGVHAVRPGRRDLVRYRSPQCLPVCPFGCGAGRDPIFLWGNTVRNTFVRHAVTSASAVSLALAATACSSGGADDKAGTKPSPGAAAPSAASPAKGKSDAEVAALVVTQADLKFHVVLAEGAAKAAAVPIGVDNAVCEPLARIQSAQKIGAPTGIGRTAAKAKPAEPAAGASAEEKLKAGLEALGGDQTLITVASYDGKGAEEAFASVKAAGTACSTGYTVTAEGEKTRLDSVTPDRITAADEAVHYSVVMDLGDGQKSTGNLVAVRRGNTLGTFYTSGHAAKFPGDLIDVQHAKIG
ncbi:hypothetical protein ACFWUQ_24020 [Streptomyces sp. NPDC058662]|uniref:hypothetical protein n=1 Tax=Streptomyces sp. NPDC058662 TaxID=3346583 RepID=UPI00364C4BF2